MSTLTPPCTASKCPSSEEPTPYGINGTRWRAQAATSAATSSVEVANTTAAGGIGGYGDSSRPWWSRTESAVENRSPKIFCTAAENSAGSGGLPRLRGEAGAFIMASFAFDKAFYGQPT